jgi:hypothetical protein
MVHAARASTASAAPPLFTRHFLIGRAPIKNARKSPENNALNFSNRLKTPCFSARFSHALRSTNPEVTHHASRFTAHQSLPTNHAFLIATHILNINLTRSQQTRKHFLIATKFDISAPASHLTDHCLTSFLFRTNKPHRIIILARAMMKTKEKQFSIRYKSASRGPGQPVAGASTLRCALRGPRVADHESLLTNHHSRITPFPPIYFPGVARPNACD